MARIEPNEIIQALEERGPAVVFAGLLSEGVEGRVRIFRGMDVREYFEVDNDDIIHVLDQENPNTPAQVLVAEDAEVVRVSRFKASVCGQPAFEVGGLPC